MSKEEVFSQINEFNQKVIDTKETKTKKFYYIQSDVAKDKASFIKELVDHDADFAKSYDEVLDICYGSGNLTSHIVLDSGIEYKNITLNDKNTEDRNNEIKLGRKTDFDFLDASQFSSQYDLIVCNPQIGGTDQNAVEFETTLIPIIYDGTLEEYLDDQGIDTSKITITPNSSKNSYLIHSDELSKSEMREKLKNIKLFNYNDVFYQSKESKIEGAATNIVKFRQTIKNISKQNTILIFFGEQKHYELLFADYTYVRQYLESSGKQLFVLGKHTESKKCFEKVEGLFKENKDCVIKKASQEEDVNFEELLGELSKVDVNEGITGMFKNEDTAPKKETEKQEGKTFSSSPKGKENWQEFTYKNILFKGVPGTGKSRAVNNIIKNELGLAKNDENVLRINIHSASSNSDLMQGIGISSDDKGQINYGEKQGLILDLIKRATFAPSQPFVLVLEEIQENSLNELIGDLIYLIEDDKRAKITADDNEYTSYESLVEHITKDESVHYVQIPFLVSSHTEYRKMIIPDNLYIFCTSNYRDDKKIIEDNLLRRFEVIEIYPKISVASEYTREFFESLNKAILEVMADEIHPDRFQIGHAIFQNAANENDFYRVLLKVTTEFKDIKEIDFDEFKKVLQKTEFPKDTDVELKNSKNYFELIDKLQTKINYSFLKENTKEND
ncbi:AAA family ATPase [Sulfurovum sp.]|jgi:hypothetical protein|uniref:AAA family ATPase n=1 Tax=Sulfurovum sp. TaxID=1969726 RepID=UPI002A36F071|nr:AAA family ATPase [Sulfurovum sp.]MDD2450813.1 AAA family ATPase [Sulfurovum sp.]MDD3499132.1 AAA family ATPase [Sulfurovum sp.]MDY0402202.1 AAA family ATPase [Sulfurovum sp.]